MLNTRCVYVVTIEETLPGKIITDAEIPVLRQNMKSLHEEVTDLLSGEFCGEVTVKEVARDAWREEDN